MMKSITRRDFMKGMLVGGVAAGSAGLLAACSSAATGDAELEEETSSSSEDTAETEEITETEETTETTEALLEVLEASSDNDEAVYMQALGEFYDTYQASLDTSLSVSERYAMMALAEAKLAESGVGSCYNTSGGGYYLYKQAYRCGNYAGWGSDGGRQWRALYTNETILADDYNYLRTLWNELRGTGTYREEAEAYLAAQGYTFSDTYTYTFSTVPTTWDTLASSKSSVGSYVAHTLEGLLQYDSEGYQQPALATGYEVSDDGLTYTFTIREGVDWVDSQGRTVATLKADDFVAGFQHMIDTQGGLQSMGLYIEGAEAYIYGETADFDTVGVKAIDDYTLQYTLVEPCSYFLTMLGYSAYMPMSRDYYQSQGGVFGLENYQTAIASSSYLYGTDQDHIAYIGAFICTNCTDKNSITYTANPAYWNAENQSVTNIEFLYNDGTDDTKVYTDYQNGLLSYCSLNTARKELAIADGIFDDYAVISYAGNTSYMGFMNLNRQAYANEDGTMASPKTVEQEALTHAALQSQNFRLAIAFAYDRATYNSVSVGDELKYITIRNTYTPADFVITTEEVTVDINGTATTFPSGTYYGEIVQAQIDADGYPIQVWDAQNNTGDGFDGFYNPDNAVEYLDKAIEELASIGYEVSVDNPIYVDVPRATYADTSRQSAEVYKETLENIFGGLVIINTIDSDSNDQYLASSYYNDYGYLMNYDITYSNGWGPDYGDPSTYLDTMLPYGDGYMTICMGMW
ncbi:MAG: ABC transporter substrate-binding protein [Lachnospiraceae bacterium]|nr:ABC transporter substrate-binding protein [Lachnospiraceae bacterium]